MASPFITEDFLLESRQAIRLYHEYAAPQPIIDYHNHLSPSHIARDLQFENITQLWLAGDHYKWRAMRACGVNENYLSGDAPDLEKFKQWCAVVPKLLGNPLYHWTHMELAKPFGIKDRLLNSETAEAVWNTSNELLGRTDFSTRGILRQANVTVLCTTDDPTDDLAHHQLIAADRGCPVRVLPTFRPDAVFDVAQPVEVNAWLDRLAFASKTPITDWSTLLTALNNRCDYFHTHGCRVADHGLNRPYSYDYTTEDVNAAIRRLRNGQAPDFMASVQLKSALLYELGLMYHRRGWVQQFHLGPLRNINTRLMKKIGRDAGCDAIGDSEMARPLARMLDRWDRDDRLAKTILYNLNPRDNELMAAMCGSFQDGTAPGKIQYGSAWWFLDQKDGIESQLTAISNLGVLGTFVGMVTDSRSFLSFSRHEYFRRILCNFLGRQMASGLLPDDVELIGQLVRDVSHDNAKRYFNF